MGISLWFNFDWMGNWHLKVWKIPSSKQWFSYHSEFPAMLGPWGCSSALFCFGKDHLAGGTKTVLLKQFFSPFRRKEPIFFVVEKFANFCSAPQMTHMALHSKMKQPSTSIALPSGSLWERKRPAWQAVLGDCMGWYGSKLSPKDSMVYIISKYVWLSNVYVLQWNEQFHNRCFVLVDW